MSGGLALNANAKNPNAFDDNFKMDLAEYLGVEQTEEYKALYTNSKRQFNVDFKQLLQALGKKTSLSNGEVTDTLTFVQPLMRQYVASLRSIQFDGTQPQNKYELLEVERNKLQQAGISFPKDVLTHFTEQGKQALFYQQSIVACDTNANGMIDKTSREERRCASGREVAQATQRATAATQRATAATQRATAATQRATAATQRAKETGEKLKQATHRADAATQRADAARQAARESFERLVNSSE